MTRPERPHFPKPPPTVIDERPCAVADVLPWLLGPILLAPVIAALLGALFSDARAQCDPLAERGCRLRLEAGAAVDALVALPQTVEVAAADASRDAERERRAADAREATGWPGADAGPAPSVAALHRRGP